MKPEGFATLRRLHLLLGLAMLLAFVGTGAYMRLSFPDLYGEDEAVRVQYRANHIYLLGTALLNLVLGLYGCARLRLWRRALQLCGSTLIVASTCALLLAFFLDPPNAHMPRPITGFSLQAQLAGVVLHLIAAVGARELRDRT